MQALTDLADLAVLLPLSASVALWLWLGGWGRGALLWSAGSVCVLALMLAAKLALLGCARPDAALASPSGHTAAASYVYGGIAALAWRLRVRAGVGIGAASAGVFGFSRIVVHAHSVPEVVLGGAVGVVVLAVFLRVAGAVPAGLQPVRLLLCAMPLVVALHGVRLNMEPRVRAAAGWFGICL